jgi:hypothetical protein
MIFTLKNVDGKQAMKHPNEKLDDGTQMKQLFG